jgi:hypothetical protein
MKRWGAMVVAIAVACCIAGIAGAKKKEATEAQPEATAAKGTGADKSYSNGEYKFSLRYPGDWQAKEQKAEAPDLSAAGAVGAMFGKKLSGGLGMTTVCFGSGKCEAGDSGKDPQADLMIADMAAMERMTSMGRKGSHSGHGGPEKSDCEEIERTSVKWGGASAPWITTRCPEKKKWRYQTAVTMQHGSSKGKDLYTLNCSMLSKSSDKTESLSEYRGDLKPRCEKIVSTTKFSK